MILNTLKLNEDGKQEIRNLIEEELKLVPSTKRVKLDRDLLEELLFIRVKYDDDKYLKLPVWSGNFLRKIDLSEVDFTDVSYSILYDVYVDKQLDNKIYEEVMNRIRRYNISSMTYYGNTNAHIDFKDSFEYKMTGKIVVHGFNFTGTDLSNNDIDDEFSFIHGYFKDTGLKISTVRDSSLAESSDFTGIDLSYYELNVDDVENNVNVFKNSCIMKNTSINIVFDRNTILEKKLFWDKYHNGDFVGCYMNRVWIKSEREIRDNKQLLIEQYNNEMDELKTRIKTIIKPYKFI